MKEVIVVCPNCGQAVEWCRKDALLYNLLVVATVKCERCGEDPVAIEETLSEGGRAKKKVKITRTLSRIAGFTHIQRFVFGRLPAFRKYVSVLPENVQKI